MTPHGTRIRLAGIRAYGRHGAEPVERTSAQPLDIDVELDVDAEKARTTDALPDTVDYAAVHRRIVALVAGTSFFLLERLAQSILDDVLEDARVRWASVTVAKPARLSGATPSVRVSSSRVS